MVTPEMIHTQYIAQKMNRQAEQFKEKMAQQEYAAAKHCYDTMITLVTFLELPDSVKMEFFGNRAYVEDEHKREDGLFPEEQVQKAYRECAVKRNLGREMQPYRPFAK